LDYWHVARWQLAGMGSAITLLLVVTVFWGERTVEFQNEFKDESKNIPMQVASAPTDTLQRKAEALTEGKLAESAADAKSQVAVQSEPAANKPAIELSAKKNETLSAASPAIIPAKKFIVASAPETVVDQDVGRSGDALVELKQQPSLDGEIAPVSAEKPVATTSIAERSDGLGKAEVDKVILAKRMPSTSENRSEARAKADTTSTVAAVENRNIARNIAVERGAALANKDIQAGVLRILIHGKPIATSAPQIDAMTGYSIQNIEGSDLSISSLDEVEAYNQAMRDWHARSGY
jgi:hypothetical protein